MSGEWDCFFNLPIKPILKPNLILSHIDVVFSKASVDSLAYLVNLLSGLVWQSVSKPNAVVAMTSEV